ncbi:hypothetical protein LCGC14_2761910, partial [marine sediment metagenome]
NIKLRDEVLAGKRDGFELEKRYLRKDGSIIWGFLKATLIRDKKNKPLYFIGQVQDITDRKTAEQALKESEEKYHKLIDSANDAIFLAEADTGILVEANEKAAELIGIPRKNIIGMHQMQLHPPEKADEYKRIFKEYVGKAKGVTPELLVQHKSGRKTPVEISSTVINVGKKVYLQGIFRDITERRKAQQALRESEELHRLTLSKISDTVLITDDKGHFTWVCANVDHIFGYCAQDVEEMKDINSLLGRKIFNSKELDKHLEIPNIEHEVKDKNGNKHTLIINVKKVNIKGGTVLYTCRDVTDKKYVRYLIKSLNEINADIHSTFDFDKIMQTVMKKAPAILDCATSGLLIDVGDHWLMKHSSGKFADVEGKRLPKGAIESASTAYSSNKPFVSNDAYNDKRLNTKLVKHKGIRAILDVP